MTDISFHTHVTDKLAYACRLIRKAYAAGLPRVIIGDATMIQRLDELLWTFSSIEFLPHYHLSDNHLQKNILAASPIVLMDSPHLVPNNDTSPLHENPTTSTAMEEWLAAQTAVTLINLDHPIPTGFERYERMIDIVGHEPAEIQAGRLRWKHYKTLNLSLSNYNTQGAN